MLLLIFVFVLLLSTVIPPAWATAITAVVTVGIALWLHFGPVPSRIVTFIGAAAGLLATIEPLIGDMLPPKAALIIAVIGYGLAAFNGRLQGVPPPEAPQKA